jgi:hypothetical protein
MMDAGLEFINAVFDRLRSTAAVTALVRQFYDVPPTDQSTGAALAAHPYVSNGPTTSIPDDYDCISGEEVTLQLDVWSLSTSTAEVRAICSAIKRTLHDAELTLTTNALVTLQWELTRILDDPNPAIRHGAIQFTATIETP